MSVVKRQKTEVVPSASRILYNSAVVLEGHSGFVLSSRFSNDGRHIVTSGFDKTIQLWNLPLQQEDVNYGTLVGHKNAVTAVKFLGDDLNIVSASADSTVGIWDATTGTRDRKCIGHELTVNDVDVTTDGSVLSVADDGYCKLWDPREKTAVVDIATEFPLLSGCFGSENTVYIAGIEPTIKAYDKRQTEKPLWTCGTRTSSITSLSVNRDKSMLLVRAMDGVIKTISARDSLPPGMSRVSPYVYDGAPSGREYHLIRAGFSDDSVTIVSGSEDNTVTAWDYKSRRILGKYKGHTGTVIDVDYHPSEKIVLSCSTDGTAIVREV